MNGELKNSLKTEDFVLSSYKNFFALKNPENEQECLLSYTEFGLFSDEEEPTTIFDPKKEKFEDLSIGERKNLIKKMKKLKINGKDRYFVIKNNSVCLVEFLFETSSSKIDLVFHNFLEIENSYNFRLVDDLLLVENYQKILIYRLENI